MPRLSRGPSRHRGAALVELAMILPLTFVLSFMVIDFGRAIYEYNLLTKTVRDAARYLSVQTPGTRIAEARNLIVYGTPTPGTPLPAPLARGLSAALVPDPVWATAGADPIINTVTVRVSGYTFETMFLGAFGVPFANVTFSDITATMRSAL